MRSSAFNNSTIAFGPGNNHTFDQSQTIYSFQLIRKSQDLIPNPPPQSVPSPASLGFFTLVLAYTVYIDIFYPEIF